MEEEEEGGTLTLSKRRWTLSRAGRRKMPMTRRRRTPTIPRNRRRTPTSRHRCGRGGHRVRVQIDVPSSPERQFAVRERSYEFERERVRAVVRQV